MDDKPRLIRAFIAIKLSSSIQHSLAGLIANLQQRNPTGVRWVSSGAIHLTLKFLGEISTNQVPIIQSVMKSVSSSHNSFLLQIEGLGAFPSALKPRIVWVGIQAPPGLIMLKNDLEQQMCSLGFDAENRSFTPHLTLGRVSKLISSHEIRSLSATLADPPASRIGEELVDAIHLYRSILNPSGAVYSQLFSTRLISS